MNSENEIQVSVCVVTYNQENYIAECIESLVAQQVDFKFEIIVGEDCSTDGTRAIVQKYVDKYPDLIIPLFHEKNVGASENYVKTHSLARGIYIAHMDGDDYALPNKIQEQAEFLNNHPECNMVFHRVNFIENGVLRESTLLSDNILEYKFYRKDIIEYVAIGANSSKMYRSSLRDVVLPNFNLVDYTVNVLQIGNGYAAYSSNNALGVYRVGVGVTGSTAVNLSVYDSLNYFFNNFRELKESVNSSAWAWFLYNLKHNKNTKWKFFSILLKTFSIKGLVNYIKSRGFRRELSGL